MKQIFLFSSIALAGGLLFVNIYTSLIDARSWGSQLPGSMATAREYYKSVTPGDFFRVFSPVNQVLALLVLILFWRSSPSIRICLGTAVVLYIIADVFTFAYFYPRNDIMFKTAALTDTASLQRAWQQWSSMNWVRSLIILAGIVCSSLALHKIYWIQAAKY